MFGSIWILKDTESFSCHPKHKGENRISEKVKAVIMEWTCSGLPASVSYPKSFGDVEFSDSTTLLNDIILHIKKPMTSELGRYKTCNAFFIRFRQYTVFRLPFRHD
jgi:hypothetical protein